jgi:hypothetical protein
MDVLFDTKFIGREGRDAEISVWMADGSNGMDVRKGQCVDMLFIFVHSIWVEEVMLLNNLPELLAVEFALISKFNVKLGGATIV